MNYMKYRMYKYYNLKSPSALLLLDPEGLHGICQKHIRAAIKKQLSYIRRDFVHMEDYLSLKHACWEKKRGWSLKRPSAGKQSAGYKKTNYDLTKTTTGVSRQKKIPNL